MLASRWMILSLVCLTACSDNGPGGSSSGPMAGCPGNAPPAGGACGSDPIDCTYDMQHCFCLGKSNPYWICNPIACPHSEASGSCAMVSLSCDYSAVASCVCSPHGWSCCTSGPRVCPSTPKDGQLCCAASLPNGYCYAGDCAHGVDSACLCGMDGVWHCDAHACTPTANDLGTSD
jgi:hypothetical protein